MTKLHHQNLVQLYGVCSKTVRPLFIITEYMKVSILKKGILQIVMLFAYHIVRKQQEKQIVRIICANV